VTHPFGKFPLRQVRMMPNTTRTSFSIASELRANLVGLITSMKNTVRAAKAAIVNLQLSPFHTFKTDSQLMQERQCA
jgi:hypothetical protein